jgi:hypothetical protein
VFKSYVQYCSVQVPDVVATNSYRSEDMG